MCLLQQRSAHQRWPQQSRPKMGSKKATHNGEAKKEEEKITKKNTGKINKEDHAKCNGRRPPPKVLAWQKILNLDPCSLKELEVFAEENSYRLVLTPKKTKNTACKCVPVCQGPLAAVADCLLVQGGESTFCWSSFC